MSTDTQKIQSILNKNKQIFKFTHTEASTYENVLLGTGTRKSKLYQIHSSKWIQLYQISRYYLEKVRPQNCLGKQETRESRRKATEFIENRVKVHQHAWEDATKTEKTFKKIHVTACLDPSPPTPCNPNCFLLLFFLPAGAVVQM